MAFQWGLVLNFFLLFSLAEIPAYALTSRYASGLLRHYAADSESSPSQQPISLHRFMASEFAAYGPSFQWKEESRSQDGQHTHFLFSLFHENTQVFGRYLKVHTRLSGEVEYASSNWEVAYGLPPSEKWFLQSKNSLYGFLRKGNGWAEELPRLRPVIWIDARAERAVAAFEGVVASSTGLRHFVVDAETAEVLQRIWCPHGRCIGGKESLPFTD